MTPGSAELSYVNPDPLNSTYLTMGVDRMSQSVLIGVAVNTDGSSIYVEPNQIKHTTAMSQFDGSVSISNNLNVDGSAQFNEVKGAGTNRFAEKVTLNGVGGGGQYVYTINNALIKPNSVIIITLENYSGSGILMHQIKSRTNGQMDVMFSQPLLTGESVVVNYMIIN
jgi:hypothetical protein